MQSSSLNEGRLNLCQKGFMRLTPWCVFTKLNLKVDQKFYQKILVKFDKICILLLKVTS
jgi:hypothetical protein